MTTGDGPPPLRIGNAERSSALKALDEHMSAGRLSVEEYADRTAAATNATVAAELAVLFTDLPEPHPDLPGMPIVRHPVPAAPGSGDVVARAQGALEAWGPRLVAVVPFVAVGLFLLTRQWVFFLLIPIAFALFQSSRRRR